MDEVSVILKKIIKSLEVRNIIGIIVPELANIWAENDHGHIDAKSSLKKLIVDPINRSVIKNFFQEKDDPYSVSLQSLLTDAEFLQSIKKEIPNLSDSFLNILLQLCSQLEAKPISEQKEIIAELFTSMSSGKSAELITSLCRIAGTLQQHDPEFLSNTLKPLLVNWISHLDMSDVKAYTESLSTTTVPFINMVNEVLWQYPSKTLLLFSLLPDIINILTKTVQTSLAHLNQLPPDLLTDVLLSLFGEMDATAFSQTVNEVTELIRKIHTGSALLGEAGSPQLPKSLNRFFNDFGKQLNWPMLIRSKHMLQQIKGTIHESWLDQLKQHPDLIQNQLSSLSQKPNQQLHALHQKLSLITALCEEKGIKQLADGISDYNADELADTLNQIVLLLNQLKQDRADVLQNAITQFTYAIDTQMLANQVPWLSTILLEQFKPIARIVLPHIVTLCCQWLMPEDDDQDDAAAQARQAISQLIAQAEVCK
ncbi:MAG: hypothetical protein HQK77_09810 [Desulfobacterales bacterium]|nr:hypothetical protein [Desulfobacterales bacterium]